MLLSIKNQKQKQVWYTLFGYPAQRDSKETLELQFPYTIGPKRFKCEQSFNKIPCEEKTD